MSRPELKAEQLALDRQHGASFLLRQALLILKDEAVELPNADGVNYLQELAAIARQLQVIRPAMASIGNGIQLFIDGLEGLDVSNCRAAPVELVTALVDDILACLELYYQRTVFNGASLIHNGARLITCSFSATVCAALTQAASEGKEFFVLVLDSQANPAGFAYGEMMASALQAGGVTCRLIPTDEVYLHTQGVTLGLVGADSILSDGALINGWPTLRLARACCHNRIPFYCLSESIKFTSSFPPGPLEKGFERIPASFITAIITEKG